MAKVEYAFLEIATPEPWRNLPEAHLLLIVPYEEKVGNLGVTTWSLAKDGAHAGDTVHESVAHAKLQAEHEWGNRVGRWMPTDWDPDRARDLARAFLARGNGE